MEISKELTAFLGFSDRELFQTELLRSLVIDAKKRNPDVANEKTLVQLARPKYNEAIKAINKELDSLKIINRRANETK